MNSLGGCLVAYSFECSFGWAERRLQVGHWPAAAAAVVGRNSRCWHLQHYLQCCSDIDCSWDRIPLMIGGWRMRTSRRRT